MIPSLDGKRVALAHHWLLSMRGGEKVLEAIARLVPGAPIYTLFAEGRALTGALREREVHTSFLDGLPGARSHHREFLPLYPRAVRGLDCRTFDVVIVSDAALTKGLRVRDDALLLCYCHSPMRSIWSLGETYAARLGSLRGWALQRVSGPLRRWDRRAAQQVSAFAANSSFVRERIARSYAREARVIHPPVDVPPEPPQRRPEDFYLMVGEMVEYKRTDLGVEACKRLGRPLVVVGDGPEGKRLRAASGPEAVFLGRVSDAEIRRLLARCRALLFCAEEDFGIVPVEAMGAGCPVIAYGVGGAAETVVDGETGLFFRRQTVDEVTDAVERFERARDTFEPPRIHTRALGFAYPVFERKITAWIDDCLHGPKAR